MEIKFKFSDDLDYNKVNENQITEKIKSLILNPISVLNDESKEQPLILNTNVSFGKYKNKTVKEIIDKDVSYAIWLVKVWKGLVTNEVHSTIKSKPKPKHKRKYY